MVARIHGASLVFGLLVLAMYAIGTIQAETGILETLCSRTSTRIASRVQPIYTTYAAAEQDCQRLAPVSAKYSDILSLETLYSELYSECIKKHVLKMSKNVRPPLWVKSVSRGTTKMASNHQWYNINSDFTFLCEYEVPIEPIVQLKICPATKYFPHLIEGETSPVICPEGELPYGGTTSTCRDGTHHVTGDEYCRKICPATEYFPKLIEGETSPVICPQGELPYGGTTSTCRNGTHRVTGLTYCRSECIGSRFINTYMYSGET
ncbi:uncharacterized protein LOC135821668 [Sycon ciliatum]|uniref:uncharacterized protein LOC135821668 n=1 Tax=Sycon ciliatum TaxID=27933 RepID=UPI0031F5FA11